MSSADLASLSVLIAGRALDLLGTRLASPDLALESNAWMRRLGWPRVLLVNALLVPGLALLTSRHTWLWIGVFSALLGVRNAQLAWTARALHPKEHGAALDRWLRTAPLRSILGPLLLESGVLVVLGAVLMDGSVVRTHERLWYVADVGRGILFFGVFVGLLRGLELHHQRRSRDGGAME